MNKILILLLVIGYGVRTENITTSAEKAHEHDRKELYRLLHNTKQGVSTPQQTKQMTNPL